MILIQSLISSFTKESFFNKILEDQITYTDSLSIIGFFVSGFLVGFGTKMANGCTSGHGVCGLPRLSKRSFAAVGTFLIFGLGFATLRYHVKFLESDFILSKKKKDDIILSENIVKIISIVFFCLTIIIHTREVSGRVYSSSSQRPSRASASLPPGLSPPSLTPSRPEVEMSS